MARSTHPLRFLQLQDAPAARERRTPALMSEHRQSDLALHIELCSAEQVTYILTMVI